MIYRSLRQCVTDLEATGQLVRVSESIDATLVAAEIQRRLYRSGGPAVLMENIRGCRFPMLCNLFGTIDRARFLFRDTFDDVRRLIELRTDAGRFWKQPFRYARALPAVLHARPRACKVGPVLDNDLTLDRLPQLKSWPDDGGAYLTLPQVYSEDVNNRGLGHSNLGMYRVQISGGQYIPNQEVGLHYQLQRGIAIHHAAALRRKRPLPVNIFLGGTPAMTLAAVMPLPEGVSELTFAGALAWHRIPMICRADQLPVYAEADFCISGTLDLEKQLPEGPFGDHLGYYSLQHEFPVLRVSRVTCRDGAIWPFTVVGRPPQEDTVFGQLIHELTAPVVPTLITGLRAVHAVDAAGVHPLMLAIGSERYVPYQPRNKPRELLTQASAILGEGQMSLSKYLWIINHEDVPELDIHNVSEFFQQVLRRVDWARDLHFHTRTTIDTLDYTGSSLHDGSKLVVAAAGPPVRDLPNQIDDSLALPDGFREPRIGLPGVLVVQGPSYKIEAKQALRRFCAAYEADSPINRFPWIVLVDDSDFTARSIDNFIWSVFTRSNPAADVDGIASSQEDKHWGCQGALVIDARIKPHHAPPLIEDTAVQCQVDAMAGRGGPISRWL